MVPETPAFAARPFANTDAVRQPSDIGRLSIQCADQPGIVAAVAGFLAEHGANIVELGQFSTDSENGEFFQRTVFHLAGLTDALADLQRDFAVQVGSRFAMKYTFTSTATPKRVAIMVSKYDHCLLELLWRNKRGDLDMEITVVVSNHPDLEADVASFGIPFVYIPVTKDTKAEAESAQLELLAGKVDLVVMARYMQILSAGFLFNVGCPVINIHHSFLPAFAGAGPYLKAKERGVKLIGATAHYATANLDEGPIIEQDVVRVSHRDGVGELERRGAEVERSVLARAVQWHCEDRVMTFGNSTTIL
ncbi:formyltetrahydrofolate deformylase [Subtercola sp. RTI3]|uniref:formyltetrahydrofolate deformylase n=1 Tax=Subtercola sp. RTI3 TaxID=3048639 RepID=UPI002B23616B|nr:formyltetrahydrofolate deformylase [Subtercola sp. RTI3]MEA9986933.1 formyltetrahydrofolate deformylase [Subtercola sp. RTI3]